MKNSLILLSCSVLFLTACANTNAPATSGLDGRTQALINEKLAPDSIYGKKIYFDYTKSWKCEGSDGQTISWGEWTKDDSQNDSTPVFREFNVAFPLSVKEYEENGVWRYTPTGPKEARLEHSGLEGFSEFKLQFKSETSGYATMEGSSEGEFWKKNSIIFSIEE